MSRREISSLCTKMKNKVKFNISRVFIVTCKRKKLSFLSKINTVYRPAITDVIHFLPFLSLLVHMATAW